MKKTRLSFRKSRWQRSDTNEIKPDYNNAFTVLGVDVYKRQGFYKNASTFFKKLKKL